MIRLEFVCYQMYVSLSGGTGHRDGNQQLGCVPAYLINQNIICRKVFIDVHVFFKMDL